MKGELFICSSRKFFFKIQFPSTGCVLSIKTFEGSLNSTILPSKLDTCVLRFSKDATNLYDPTQPPGLVIKLLQLNAPCNQQSSLSFNQSDPPIYKSFCGKLQEIPRIQRTLHFKSFEKTQIVVKNNSNFRFSFQLVDFCYDVTFLEPNGSFAIKRTGQMVSCFLKIHLPYGNRISIRIFIEKLLRGRIASNNALLAEISLRDKSHGEMAERASLQSKNECNGIWLRMTNQKSAEWTDCLIDSKTLSLQTQENFLLIEISKSPNSVKMPESTVVLEYSAIADSSIVSKCAFGWISIGTRCFKTIYELSTWQRAEQFCEENFGGNLASIGNESQQQVLDQMLFNR